MKQLKVHYTTGGSWGGWTACSIFLDFSEYLTKHWLHVTCKNCLRQRPKEDA